MKPELLILASVFFAAIAAASDDAIVINKDKYFDPYVAKQMEIMELEDWKAYLFRDTSSAGDSFLENFENQDEFYKKAFTFKGVAAFVNEHSLNPSKELAKTLLETFSLESARAYKTKALLDKHLYHPGYYSEVRNNSTIAVCAKAFSRARLLPLSSDAENIAKLDPNKLDAFCTFAILGHEARWRAKKAFKKEHKLMSAEALRAMPTAIVEKLLKGEAKEFIDSIDELFKSASGPGQHPFFFAHDPFEEGGEKTQFAIMGSESEYLKLAFIAGSSTMVWRFPSTQSAY